jgi:filamentous hemagglutinin family protein
VQKPGGIIYGVSSITTSGAANNNMTIYQSQSQAIIDWSSFNIGSNSSVYFNQQGKTGWAALNRIWDANASQIYGKLRADGQIYLINQNGILFGPGSQVDVHTLIASSLNFSIDNFLAGSLMFSTSQGTMSSPLLANSLPGYWYAAGQHDPFYSLAQGQTPGVVTNAGTITTDNLGSVFLIGPQVENIGTITSPLGQIGLVAGQYVEIVPSTLGATYPDGLFRTAKLVNMDQSPLPGSTATNYAGGLLEADTGLVGMYGNIVNQNGVIRSITAVQQGAHVELLASGTINTGPGSLIDLPVSTSPELVISSQPAQSSVTLSGLDAADPPNLIVHNGSIVAPWGIVTMNAASQVYLGSGSVIDVSGLWLSEPASAGLLSVQMNSVQLADNFIQKGGVLQGAYINMSQVSGSAIGDVSGAFTAEGLTAMQAHTAGGTVNINVASGSVIAMQGSLINFSGGGTVYAGGVLNTTELVSGNNVYNIAAANPNIEYDSILNVQTFTNTRYGVTQEFDGIYYGGAYALYQYVPQYTVGANAGSLNLLTGQVVLDGVLLGRATRGLQQTAAANPVNSTGNQSASGWAEPAGGQLTIGNTGAVGNTPGTGDSTNFYIGAIDVSAQTGPLLPASFKPGDSLPFSNTILSAATLTNAGLGTLSLAANTTITIEKGAQVTLNPGGAFNAWARSIEDYGGITAPAGSINLSLQTDMTTNQYNPSYVNIPFGEMIYIGPSASLVAAGQRIDNSVPGSSLNTGVIAAGYTSGGSVSLLDQTVTGQGVAIMPGALIDVSGGWLINSGGKVTGGNAGTVTLQGSSIILDGTLNAQSLLGNKGGTLSVIAANVTVAPTTPAASFFSPGDPWPAGLVGQFVLGAGQLDPTGFTTIALGSVNSVIVESGATLGPSLAKLAAPLPGGSAAPAGPGAVQPSADTIGATSITLAAGASGNGITSGLLNQAGPLNPGSPNYSAVAQVSSGASVQAAPGGSITLKGPNVDVGGLLSAPAGTITLKASYGDVTLEPGAQVLAEGYDKPGTTSVVKGLAPDETPLPGGTVSLTASSGNINLDQGSLVSVSGSSPVPQTVIGQDNTISRVMVASPPGTISLTADGTINLSPQAFLEAQASLAGLPGGTLSLSTTAPTSTLSLTVSQLARFGYEGFDALTLSSAGFLNLSNPDNLGQVNFGRSLTLNAPEIQFTGTGADRISLSAPWVQVTNTTTNTTPQPSAGNAAITLSGAFVDVTGSVVFSGFSSVTLAADLDIRLSDFNYGSSWVGLLGTAGDLTLQAARVYPTTLSLFTVNAGGKVTILPSATTVSGPIYSAGGSLTIQAGGGIDQEGVLAAPMGSLSLAATGTGLGGRVYLAPGSVTTTAGDAAVLYGMIQESYDTVTLGDNVWAVPDRANPSAQVPWVAVQNLPASSISLNGNTVIVQNNALVDVSGGGSVFAYRFVPSSSGSTNPLTAANTYVILPDNSVVLPGSAVYLAGGDGLKAGVYSLLPAQYAFLPGAMVITALGTTFSTAQAGLAPGGFPIIGGYATVMGTNIRSPLLEAYEVRPASVVLSEGYFSTQTLQAGNAGAVTITGNTAVLGGTIQAAPLPGYNGGSLALSGNAVTVEASTIPLPAGFSFSTPVPNGLVGTLNVAASSLSGQGFETIGIGVSNLNSPASSVTANTVVIEPGVTLQAENIILGAQTSITLGAGAQVLALASGSGTGQATFISPGALNIGANVVVHATDAVNFQVGTLSLDPSATILADHSVFDLTGSTITLVGAGVPTPSGTGLFLTQSQWNSLEAVFPDLDLTAASGLVFDGPFNLSVQDALTINAARIAASTGSSGSSQVTASSIVLENTGAPSTTPNGTGPAQISFNATEMQIGPGTILFDQFSKIGVNVMNSLTFSGVGSLSTGGARLSVSTAQVATTYSMAPAGPAGSTAAALPPIYTAANFSIDAGGTGTVTIQPSGGTAGTNPPPGGSLSITDAREIDISTANPSGSTVVVDVPSGQLTFAASGNITLGSGAVLSAQASPYAPGGVISLTSTGGGMVTLGLGSLIDVSPPSGSQGSGGSINLYAPIGGVVVAGNLAGQAPNGGPGSSLSLVTNTLDTVAGVNIFSSLNGKIGEFTQSLSLEAMTGNITIAPTDTVTAGNVTITADSGSINVLGQINASGTAQGGTVALYAGTGPPNSLTVSGSISAAGIGGTGQNAPGGSVTLGVGGPGQLVLSGLIDVSGYQNNQSVASGSVTFQAPVINGNSLNISLAKGSTINGASAISVDAVQTYTTDPTNNNQAISLIGAGLISYIETQTSTFMNTYAPGLKNNLLSGLTLKTLPTDQYGNPVAPASVFSVQPSIVIQSQGNLTLGSEGWDLSAVEYAGAPGTLTLRAGGNLTISGSLVSAPTYESSYDITQLLSTSLTPSWSFNLVAGASTASPNLMAVMPGGAGGSLTISPYSVVYTETGALRFASAGNTVINETPSLPYMIYPEMNYTLATYSGPIIGNVGGSLTINPGGAIQSATGSIDISVGGNLNMVKGYVGDLAAYSLGSIRTTGETTDQNVYEYTSYGNGGSITLNVAGAVNGDVNPDAWLMVPGPGLPVTAQYGTDATGSLNVSTEGIAAMAGGSVYVRSGLSFDGQTGTFGPGDLQVYSGGNMTGRFLVLQGTGTLSAMGNFGMPTQLYQSTIQNQPQLIEMSAAQVSVSAQGNIELGAALNPNLAAVGEANPPWENLYNPQSSLTLKAVTGDVNLYGTVDTNRYGGSSILKSTDGLFYDPADAKGTQTWLPPSVYITAGTDINVMAGFTQLPYSKGELTMTAGRNIVFSGGVTGTWTMSDAGYGQQLTSHAPSPVHTGDNLPVVITAGGDIVDAAFTLPKMATIMAKGNIQDITYNGQNIGLSDVTTIAAGGSILFGSTSTVSREQILVGGPGYLVVEAGGTIDLGYSTGILEVGNTANPALYGGGSLIVAAGLSTQINAPSVPAFFLSLQDAGTQYSELKAAGDAADAQAAIAHARTDIIAPLLGSANPSGNISLTSSQISTASGGAIYVLATGELDVGTNELPPTGSQTGSQTRNTGILTEKGGAINVFATGDINVNTARIMSFMGGDITAWSDQGSINAGTGNKATISVSAPSYSCTNGVCTLTFSPPAVGSGIRALTYAPSLSTPAPPAGDIYLFAPQGVINAGEAGISGGKVILGAQAVLNVANISFSSGSVGVPTASQGVSIGALMGATSLGQSASLTQDTGALSGTKASAEKQLQPIEDIMMKWLDIQFIGFDLAGGG